MYEFPLKSDPVSADFKEQTFFGWDYSLKSLDYISHWSADSVLPDSLPVFWISGEDTIISLSTQVSRITTVFWSYSGILPPKCSNLFKSLSLLLWIIY